VAGKHAIWLLAAALALPGCAGSYFRSYQRAHPDWAFTFPDPGANLEQTVASLYAPPPQGTELTIRRLEILRLDTEPWRPIPFDELRRGAYRSDDAADYAVVADVICESRLDGAPALDEKLAWYLLTKNRLRAFDHHAFAAGCAATNAFVPAPAADAEVEREVQQHVASEYPDSTIHVGELFQKGIVYARANRIDDARRMLNEGRSAFETPPDAPGAHVDLGRPAETRRMRDQLVREIAAAEARGAGD